MSGESFRNEQAYVSNEDTGEKMDMNKEKTHIPKVSVVIPMYNCERFVPGLFQMFSNQSFSDFEIICVIDGATDNTEKAVRDLCKNDSRFKYVVQENAGAGIARNTGLELAKGAYTVFSDADDEYYIDYLKKLYETAVKHDAQIVICHLLMDNYKTGLENILGFNEKRFQEDVSYSHTEIKNIFGAFTSCMNNKMYNTGFLKDNGIKFQDIPIAEDSLFVCSALCMADRILVTNNILSRYRLHINEDSLSAKRPRLQHEAVNSLRLLYRWLKDHSLLDMHWEDYMLKVNGSIIYAGKYMVNPGYISELAHMLNAEEPFNTMTPQEILVYLEEGLQANEAIRNKTEMLTNISRQMLETDEELSSMLRQYENRIRNAELLCQKSRDQYGRNFK